MESKLQEYILAADSSLTGDFYPPDEPLGGGGVKVSHIVSITVAGFIVFVALVKLYRVQRAKKKALNASPSKAGFGSSINIVADAPLYDKVSPPNVPPEVAYEDEPTSLLRHQSQQLSPLLLEELRQRRTDKVASTSNLTASNFEAIVILEPSLSPPSRTLPSLTSPSHTPPSLTLPSQSPPFDVGDLELDIDSVVLAALPSNMSEQGPEVPVHAVVVDVQATPPSAAPLDHSHYLDIDEFEI